MKKQSISVVLLATILLQSCVAYQKTSVSLNEAYNRGRVRVLTQYDKKFDVKNIIYEEGEFYAIKLKDGGKIRIDTASSSSLKFYLKDYKKSKHHTRLLVTGIVLGFTIPLIIAIGSVTLWPFFVL